MTLLAPGVRRPARQLLVGTNRVLRLSDAGADALDALLEGRAHPGVDALRRRLLDAGMLLLPPGPPRLTELTVVVPARGPAGVDRVRGSVPGGVPVLVVPDEGEPPRGPAATRNLGAAQATTALIAFVDTGVLLPAGALERLTGFFADERVVAVAPRIVSDGVSGLVGVLEQQLCALDLGPAAGEVRPGAVVPYVPSTVLVVRRKAFDAAGGFDERLHVGEDVDLVWRLSEHGVVRYDPDVVVHHAPRTSLRAALRRRRDYGGSAGALDATHPGRLRHLRLTRRSALPWAAALVHPVAGGLAAAAQVVAAPRRLPSLPPAEARRLTAAGQWSAFTATGRYAVRPALPLTLAALAVSRRARRLGPLLGVAYVAGSPWRSGPVRGLPARAVVGTADDLAYSAGVWESALRTRRWRVLVPGGQSTGR
ncbi:MAG: hypothetical protein EPN99_10610 [Frankiales bacterium]|nr:MAG: hypothetical protein EPN99_10610 [Frankiales bacterium]